MIAATRRQRAHLLSGLVLAALAACRGGAPEAAPPPPPSSPPTPAPSIAGDRGLLYKSGDVALRVVWRADSDARGLVVDFAPTRTAAIADADRLLDMDLVYAAVDAPAAALAERIDGAASLIDEKPIDDLPRFERGEPSRVTPTIFLLDGRRDPDALERLRNAPPRRVSAAVVLTDAEATCREGGARSSAGALTILALCAPLDDAAWAELRALVDAAEASLSGPRAVG